MNTDYRRIFDQIDRDKPTHAISIFRHWISKDDWEQIGYSKVSQSEKDSRKHRRADFICKLSERSKSFLQFEPATNNTSMVSRTRIIQEYLDGRAGSFYVDPVLQFVFQAGYVEDDADSVWITVPLPVLVQEVLSSCSLYLIKIS